MNTAMDCEDVPGKETGRLLVLESGKEPVLITDGMTVAEDGSLFIAHWGGHAIRRYDPVTGEELAVYELPVPIPTCCAFGGRDMDELYITTSSLDSPEEEYPLAGSVLVIKPGVKGIRPYRFKL